MKLSLPADLAIAISSDLSVEKERQDAQKRFDQVFAHVGTPFKTATKELKTVIWWIPADAWPGLACRRDGIRYRRRDSGRGTP
ncbi:MAG: hypothetical protein KF708_09000 [Pirellulales bacterium]|nr:hypothetical protein [Pirellulales bacterium]